MEAGEIGGERRNCTEDVGCGVILDSRLALIHRDSGWMAVADLHFGYEVNRRAAGGLFPLWGMAAIEGRIGKLLDEYMPRRLILVGDIVDGRNGSEAAVAWLRKLGERCELVCVRGNHDRGAILKNFGFVDWHREDNFVIHHGDRELKSLGAPGREGEIEMVGHFHPALSLGDGAGTVLRLPALVQDEFKGGTRWVLPAFSPWAGGGKMVTSEDAKFFGCGNGRIFRR